MVRKKKKKHADDTTLHVLQPSDAQIALDDSIALFCAATCSQLNVSKSAGFLVQAQPLASATIAALPGINFITGQQTVFFFFFFFFFWVTGELPILRQQEAAADARRT